MKKNFLRFSCSFFPGFFLVVFLFFNFSASAQRILNVEHDLTSICQGENFNIEFQVKNGTGGTFGFDTETIYTVQIIYYRFGNQNNYIVSDQFQFTNKQGPPKQVFAERQINHNLSISSNLNPRNDYRLLVTASNPDIPVRNENFSSDTFEVLQNNNTLFSETENGNNSWIGHIYDGTNQNRAFNENFINYIGGYTEPLTFDQSFGGNQNNFQLGSGSCSPFVNTETFSVRYRMNSSLKGIYAFNLGSDDGSRLNVDGQLVYNDWNDHGYRNQNVLLSLSGNSNLVLDYYENGGGNRISAGAPQLLIENMLSINTNQTLNSQNSPQLISGDSFGNLPTGISKNGSGYQWSYSISIGGTTTIIPGATQATYLPNINSAPFNTPGKYYIVRTASLIGNNTGQNNYNGVSRSNVAIVNVEEPISISSQPQDVVTCSGSPVNYTVLAQGQNLRYQWQRNDGGSSTNFFAINNGIDFNNTQTPNLTVNAAIWMNNFRFRVIITGLNGVTKISNSALLQVNQAPQGINTHPTNQLVCEGYTISFQTYTSNDQRQWQVSQDSGTSWSDLSNNAFYQNVNAERLEILNTPASFHNNLYRIKVSNQNCSVYSNPAALEVDGDPITQQPQNTTAAFGANAIFQAGVIGNNLSFQWQTYSTNWYNIDDNDNYSGTKTKRLELITVGYFPIDGSRYRLLVTNANGCVAISDTAYLSVGEAQCPGPPNITLNAPSTTCPGQINISGSFTGTSPWTIEATINGQTFNVSINERNFSFPLNIQEDTTIEILNITDGNDCENSSPNESVTVDVINQINNNIISGAKESCGIIETSTLLGENLGEGYSYLWEESTTSQSTGFTAASGINTEVNYTIENVSQTTWYRRIVDVQNCTDTISNVVAIIINSSIPNNHIGFFNGNTGSITGMANENQVVNLTAPPGTQFTYVNFSSYGTPTNSNGSFDINENCHALVSQSISESYILGNTMVSIPATNGVFTDPCVGTVKRLYSTATYSEPFCIGIDPGTVQGSEVNGSTISYSWQVSLEGPNSGFTAASGINNEQNYNPGVLNQNIWLKRIVNSGSCLVESPVLFIPVKGENVWTGITDSNWNDNSNWSCYSLPTLETDVLIPENLASNTFPVINGGTNALAKNLDIQNGASVQVNDTWLRIAGDLTNSGILNTEAGSISFEGSTEQNILDGAFENNRIKNLTINNISGVTSEAIIEVTGILKAENGTLNTGNTLTLVSNSEQTALIDGSGNGQVLGVVKMQRYLDVAFGYKYFSSPFINSIVGDFASYIDLNASFPNFYRYDENRNDGPGRDATGFEAYVNPIFNLHVLEGYALNFGAERASPKTIELSGTVNNGYQEIALLNNDGIYTQGFNLVGNPYPSPIDWNASTGWTKSNIDDALYFFTAGNTTMYTGIYTSYVNGIQSSDELSSNIIPSMQGFFVHVTDTGNYPINGMLGMTNEVRVTNFSQQFLKTPETGSFKGDSQQHALIRVSAGFENELGTDPTVIYFPQFADLSFEKDKDALKLMNTDKTVPNLYSLTPENKKLSINALPEPTGNNVKKIPLGLKIEREGWMLIDLNALQNLPTNFNVYLIDSEKRIGQNLSRQPTYRFYVESGQHDTRFHLIFSETELSDPAIAFDEPFSVRTVNGKVMVSLNLEPGESGVLLASTVTGQILDSKNVSEKETIEIEGIKSSGVYFFSINLKNGMFSKKVLIQK